MGSHATELPVRDAYLRHRRALARAGIVCPAGVLTASDTAAWVRRRGIPVAVRSSEQLALAVAVGITPARIVMHGEGGLAGPLRCAVNAGVGQFVVDSGAQVAILAQWARRPLRVLVDVTGQTSDVSASVFASDRLEVIGLHCRVTGDRVAEMIDRMAQIRRERGLLVSRLSLETAIDGDPRRLSATIEEALDEACARFRFPRPAIAVSLC